MPTKGCKREYALLVLAYIIGAIILIDRCIFG